MKHRRGAGPDARADRHGRGDHRHAAAGQVGGPPAAAAFPAPLRSADLGRLLLTGALVNAALSATEVALTGYVRYHHALWAVGPLLAGVSAGSILGSLLLGAQTSGARTMPDRLPRLLACYAGGLAVLTAAGLDPPLLAVAAR